MDVYMADKSSSNSFLKKRKRIVLGSPNKKVSSRLDTRREKGRVSASFVEK